MRQEHQADDAPPPPAPLPPHRVLTPPSIDFDGLDGIMRTPTVRVVPASAPLPSPQPMPQPRQAPPLRVIIGGVLGLAALAIVVGVVATWDDDATDAATAEAPIAAAPVDATERAAVDPSVLAPAPAAAPPAPVAAAPVEAVAPAPVAPPPPVEEPVNEAVAARGTTPVEMNAFFAFNSARPRITPKDVERFVAAARACGDAVLLTGHSCSLGTEDAQRDMGIERAQAAKKLLVREGLDAGSIRVKSAGGTQPLGSNDSQSGRRMNRRVSLTCGASAP